MKHVVFDCDGTLLDTNIPRYRLFPGIKELVQELAETCHLYVWTARGRASTLRILEEQGILQYFEGISTPDDNFPKPHIAGLIDLLGKTPSDRICVIGDTSNDMIGAKNFGVTAIGCTWSPGTSPHVLKDFGADFIVSHPSECSKLIQLNLKGVSDV